MCKIVSFQLLKFLRVCSFVSLTEQMVFLFETIDVRELVELEDVMEAEDLKLGPNGGLVFCME